LRLRANTIVVVIKATANAAKAPVGNSGVTMTENVAVSVLIGVKLIPETDILIE
jgi:hypothetical protein